jgi:glutathione S-transferase
LAYFEQVLADSRPYLAGTLPTVADCTLGAALQFARYAKLDVLGAYPQLVRWDAAYRAREPARAVLTV